MICLNINVPEKPLLLSRTDFNMYIWNGSSWSNLIHLNSSQWISVPPDLDTFWVFSVSNDYFLFLYLFFLSHTLSLRLSLSSEITIFPCPVYRDLNIVAFYRILTNAKKWRPFFFFIYCLVTMSCKIGSWIEVLVPEFGEIVVSSIPGRLVQT